MSDGLSLFDRNQLPPTKARNQNSPASLRLLGVALAVIIFGIVGYVDYIYLTQGYEERASDTVKKVVDDIDGTLNSAVREANDRVRSLEAFLRSSEDVELSELAAFASVTQKNRLTIVKAYGWLPFNSTKQALIVNDHVRSEMLPIEQLNPEARDLLELGQPYQSTIPDALSGGLMSGESDNTDLITVLRTASLDGPGQQLSGAFFVTYSIRRIVALSPLPAGSTISEVALSSKGEDRKILAGRLWGHKSKPTPAIIDLGGPSLRVVVQAPQVDFLTYVKQDEWKSQFALLVVLMAVVLNSYMNVRQIALGRKAAKAAALAAEAAQQAGYQKTRFLATMSHEMRTPLNGIIGMADLLLDSPLDETQRKNASTLSSSAQNLLALINQILDFSKIEAREVHLDTHEANLGELLTNVTNAVGVLAAAKRIEMVLILPIEACAIVRTDSMKLRQILTNLMSNAIKFTSRGSVTLEVERTKTADGSGRFRFTVRDTGIGIAPDRVASIFEPFEQEDISTTRAYGGTGLGLTITRDLVEAMGGKIEVTSSVDDGSTFAFELDFDIVDDAWPLRRERCVVGIQNILVAMPPSPRRKATQIAITSVGGECELLDEPEQANAALLAAQKRNDPYDLVLVEDGHTAKTISNFATTQGMEKLKIGIIRSSAMGNHPATHQEQIHAHLLLNAPHTALTLTQAIASAFHHRAFTKPLSEKPVVQRTTFAGLRVLLVDDDSVNQYYGVSLLEKLGCTVATATDGLEAIAAFGDGENFDVVFMDCQMPIMDGLTATRELRKRFFDGKAKARPIVALTANSQAEDQQACFSAGMKEFLSKPVRQADVIEVLARLAPDAMSATTAESAPDSTHNPGVQSDPADAQPSSSAAREPMGGVTSSRQPSQAIDMPDASGSHMEIALPVAAPRVSQQWPAEHPSGQDHSSTSADTSTRSADDAVVGTSPETELVPVDDEELIAQPAGLGLPHKASAPLPDPTTPEKTNTEPSQPAILGAERMTRRPAPPPSTVGSKTQTAALNEHPSYSTETYIPEGEILSLTALRDTRDMLGANFTKLLQTFVDATPKKVGALDFDIDSRNYEEVRRNAHSLKSSAKMVGALAMSNAAQRLEEEARKSSPNRQLALAYSAALRQSYRGFLEKLQQLRKTSSAA